MVKASAEKFEPTGPCKKERVASVPQRESSWRVHQSHLCQKEKSRLSRSPDCEMGDSKGEQKPHLGKRKEDQRGSMERKTCTPQ